MDYHFLDLTEFNLIQSSRTARTCQSIDHYYGTKGAVEEALSPARMSFSTSTGRPNSS